MRCDAGTVREKLTTNVAFPLKGLRLGAFASEEAGVGGEEQCSNSLSCPNNRHASGLRVLVQSLFDRVSYNNLSSHAGDKDGGPEYDLYAVINHTGTMAGGHYVATCRAAGALCSAL
jgi:Ubiquitin carboxyl-terminal hydrolase